MKAVLTPAWAILSADRATIDKIHALFSYKDKGAEHDLVRFKKGESFKQSRMEEVPAWYKPWYDAKLADLKNSITVHACVLSDDGSLMVPIGLYPRLQRELPGLEVEDLRNFDVNRRHLGQGTAPTLRRPQVEALRLLMDNRGGLPVIATGVGKTVLGEQFILQVGARAIFLVPSTRILKQTVKRFERMFGAKNVGEFSGDKKQIRWITVATYQSVFAAETGDFDEIDVMIADEVHHVAARTFYEVAQERLRNAVYRVGLTADEERADGGTILVHAAVGEPIYRYPAKQAIEDGYLAAPTHYMYAVTQTRGTYKRWKMSPKTKKRTEVGVEASEAYDGDDEGTAYKNWVLGNDYLNEFVSSMAMALAVDGQSVFILVDEIEHGEKLAEMLPGFGFVKGGSKDNDWIIDAFNARKLRGLIGTSVVSEGTDLVPVDWMFHLEGGASASRTRQSDGRALRNDPDPVTFEPRKPFTNVVDFRFPLSPVLNRHADCRAEIHLETGEVHELEMP